MWGKTGDKNPNWKGGVSGERQVFYETIEWKQVTIEVWQRDDARCQECDVRNEHCEDNHHIHHIYPFSYRELRTDPDNLVLLCKKCHSMVHSLKNTNGDRKWLPKILDNIKEI
jgi:5-methylcytosine-specific restriction endonuclease McrA